ncbi:Cytochrome P450 72A15 [Cinnamomum micranthum f. kanehirae]|uniref:Cytochrome P450 72A15 n=1 Tax=Cinnamomum micranthum f. kanehirae TaxID=337451 RepID=A0A443PE97_9MAGN|nr:Cytochrome P450 72A15 [Cinnamomum micranthum f. kanehirae]
MSKWEKLIGSKNSSEIDVWPELQDATADVIARTGFSTNYKDGMRIFHLQREQAELVIKATQTIYVPGFSYLPTKDNIRRKEINIEVESMVTEMIQKRKKAMEMGDAAEDDMLTVMVEAYLKESQQSGDSKSLGLTFEEVLEECKLFFFAGHETTSVLLTFTMIVLSMHPDWQEKAREEVLQVTMIIFEVLRLYPPAVLPIRRTYKEVKLGEYTLPPGVQLSIPLIFIHHDPELWGEDVDEFKPDRFSEGFAKAGNHQLAFFPFGWGPQICIGQNFTMLEAKLALAMILQRFSFELSPSYAHAPCIEKMAGVMLKFLLLFCVLLLSRVWKLFYTIWWKPMKLQSYLNQQGIHGERYKLIHGNLKDTDKSWEETLSKPINLTHSIPHRIMVPMMFTCWSELVSKWEKQIGSKHSHEINAWPELLQTTADVIARTGFSTNYKEGMRIFRLEREQAQLVLKATQTIHIPGFSYLPTKENIRRKEINTEVTTVLTEMIEKRRKAVKMGDAVKEDILSVMIEAHLKQSQENGNPESTGLTFDEVIDECKLLFFAGHETTASLLTFTMIVLSIHPEWQEKAREEVLRMTMIIYEVLRLYPPGVMPIRRTYKEVKLGEYTIPPGVQLAIPIIFIHHDPELWGEDVDEFKPERFSEGFAKAANHQLAFLPFGTGPQVCIGQNFTMLETKIALSMILQRFSFELSPSYAHAPCVIITLQPQYGAQIILHKL